MTDVCKRLGMPSPWKASTLEMCRVISNVSGLPLKTVWKGHPLGRYGRERLRHHYITALNAMDFGVDLNTASEIGAGRVFSMVFEDLSYLHPLDRERKES